MANHEMSNPASGSETPVTPSARVSHGKPGNQPADPHQVWCSKLSNEFTGKPGLPHRPNVLPCCAMPR